MHLINSFRYRPEIDGLRAIAVLAVVLYHAELGVTGGFIGVDVFFVISGYLITSLIVKELEAGEFTLVRFWARRIRRILPALVVVVLATLVAGWFLLLPDDYASLGKSALFQGLCAANIHLWKGIDTSYFGGRVEELPLLHTWSLAVEEQFYMVVPLLLLGLFRYSFFRRRKVLLAIFGAGIALSLIASIYGVTRHPAAAFYLLPTRAWELLCGAIVAISPPISIFGARALREALTWIALTFILIPCLLYSKDTPFPGLAALPPCLGTALFIWASDRPRAVPSHPVTLATLFSNRLIVFIGLISYSLYLWHWPLFAFSTYWAIEPPSFAYRVGVVAMGFALAVLSWRFVETPLRNRVWISSRKSTFVFGAVATAAVTISGSMLLRFGGVPSRFSTDVQHFALAKSDSAFIRDHTTEDILAGRLTSFGDLLSENPVEWLVWGDSHAMAALPAFDAFLKERRLSGQAATHSATAPVLDYFLIDKYGLGSDAPGFNNAVLSYLRAHRIKNVALVANWSAHNDNVPHGGPSFDASLIKTAQEIQRNGAQTWVMLGVPKFPFNVPKALAKSAIFGQDITRVCASANTAPVPIGSSSQLVTVLQETGVRVIDPRPAFLSENQSHYIVTVHGVSLYRDGGHLTAEGAKLTLLPLLRRVNPPPSSLNR